MFGLSTIVSAVTFLGVKGLIGAVVGAVVTVAVPAVGKFVTKQWGWFQKKETVVAATVATEVKNVATSAAANAVSAVVTSVEKKL
jgi:hypothetical protein